MFFLLIYINSVVMILQASYQKGKPELKIAVFLTYNLWIASALYIVCHTHRIVVVECFRQLYTYYIYTICMSYYMGPRMMLGISQSSYDSARGA